MSDAFSKIFAQEYDDSISGQYYRYRDKVTDEVKSHHGEVPLKHGQGYPPGIEEGSVEAFEYDKLRNEIYGLPDSVLDDKSNQAIRDNQKQGSEINDANFVTAAKILHDYFNRARDITTDVTMTMPGGTMAGIEIPTGETKTERVEAKTLDYDQAAQWGQNFVIGLNHNIGNLVFQSSKLSDAPPEVAKAMYYLLETADRDGLSFKNAMTAAGYQAMDAANYIGLGTFGIGLAGKQVGKSLTKMALKDALKKIILSAPTKAEVAVAAEGALFMAADNLARQNIEIKAEKKDEIDKGDLALDMGLGGAFGGGMSRGLNTLIDVAPAGFKAVKTKLGEVFAPKPKEVNPVVDDLPTISLEELSGKKIFPIQADLTKAGGEFTGIDSSQIDVPIILQGGPNFVNLASSRKSGIVWAVDAKSKTSAKLNKDADYALVVSMSPDSHKTNATVTQAMIETSLAYLRDGRITDDVVAAVDNEIKGKFPEFPGLKSDGVAEYVRSLNFEQRKILMDSFAGQTAQQGGFPNMQAILDATIEPEYVGLNSNDSIMLIKIHKDKQPVKLGEGGSQEHLSYEFGLQGEPVGKIPMLAAKKLFPDFFAKREAKEAEILATGKTAAGDELKGKPNTARSFQFQLPVEELTPEKIELAKKAIVEKIKNPTEARLVMDFMAGNWSTTQMSKKSGQGITALDWIKEARTSAEGITLSIPKGPNGERLNDNAAAKVLEQDVKEGKLILYSLGSTVKNAPGKKGVTPGSRTMFGIRPNENYNEVYDGIEFADGYDSSIFNDADKALVSVLSNDRASNGIGKSTVLKAVEEGVTVLDCYAVPSQKHPNGFLPKFYKQFGFTVVGKVPFNKEYAPKGKEFDDLIKVWRDRGWEGSVDNGPFPDIVIMKYEGGEDARKGASKRFITTGSFSTNKGATNRVVSNAVGNDGQPDGSTVGGVTERSNTNNRSDDSGNVRDGDGTSTTNRLTEVAKELLSLSKDQIENLGLDYDKVQALKLEYGGAS